MFAGALAVDAAKRYIDEVYYGPWEECAAEIEAEHPGVTVTWHWSEGFRAVLPDGGTIVSGNPSSIRAALLRHA